MAYFAPFIDESGIHMPTYQDIEDYLVEAARSIYGQDIYLENDSQDFQLIAAQAKAAYDTLLTAQYVYNSMSPATAIGTGLDLNVALSGIQRKPLSYSTVTVTLVGTAFTEINNGVVADINGVKWNLPSEVTIGADGTVNVTATCQDPGDIAADAGSITQIDTPTFGWTSVSNANAATPGQPVEEDSDLRARHQTSVANPSQALTTGILGAILEVTNVTDAQLYENDTNVPVGEVNGIVKNDDFPGHSITCVVEGGDNEDVAEAIWLRKTPGCWTEGDVEVEVLDPYNNATTIRFYRPTYVTIAIEITIEAEPSYTSAIGDNLKQAVVDYVNTLQIGQKIINSKLRQAALSVDTGQYPLFSLTDLQAGIDGNPVSTSNIQLLFDQKVQISLDDITLTVN